MVTLQSTNNKFVHVESDTISLTITKESAILEGSATSLNVNVSSERQDIHNWECDSTNQNVNLLSEYWTSIHLCRKRADWKAVIHLIVSRRCLLQPSGQWRMGLLHHS